MYCEDEFIPLSLISEYVYCKRRAVMRLIEQVHPVSYYLTDGKLAHEKVHDATKREQRGDVLYVRGLHLYSSVLGVSGVADMIEFHLDDNGVSLTSMDGLWSPVLIEYKRGVLKTHEEYEAQLCAQAICLEEMLCCSISSGYLFYTGSHRRDKIDFTDDLRCLVQTVADDLHRVLLNPSSVSPVFSKKCSGCSMYDICMTELTKQKVLPEHIYIQRVLKDL